MMEEIRKAIQEETFLEYKANFLKYYQK